MSPQEIGLIVLLVVIAGYVAAALWPRSGSAGEPADIILESRLPGAEKRNDELIPASGKNSLKNTRRTRRKSEPVSDAAVKQSAQPVRIQRHHDSPKPDAKSDQITEAREEEQPSASSAPVRSAAAVSAPVREARQAPERAETETEAEAIDPELTGQISELDDRLDAIEELVASIEESLATFDLLEDSPAGEAQAA